MLYYVRDVCVCVCGFVCAALYMLQVANTLWGKMATSPLLPFHAHVAQWQHKSELIFNGGASHVYVGLARTVYIHRIRPYIL
jgi:hypothetical protein